jgi:hypothetical protein
VIGRALAVLLGVTAAGCGGDSVLVPVTLNLDSLTCGTNSPAQVSLSCDSAVGAWVRRGDPADPSTAEDACVDFASNGESLADLPAVLSDSVDLSGISAGDVWLEIGVYSPASAADGCPDISALDSHMVAYGRTSPSDLSNASRGIELIVACYAVDVGIASDTCTADCEEDLTTYCPCGAESGPCDRLLDDCYNACAADDEPCYAACDADWETCIDDQPTPCDDALTRCLDDCSGDLTCEDACYDDYDDCIAAGCQTAHTTCLARCSALEDATCASAL